MLNLRKVIGDDLSSASKYNGTKHNILSVLWYMSCYIHSILLYLGAGNRNRAIPIGHPELRGCPELSMKSEFQ